MLIGGEEPEDDDGPCHDERGGVARDDRSRASSATSATNRRTSLVKSGTP
jgi:hypothetical protein